MNRSAIHGMIVVACLAVMLCFAMATIMAYRTPTIAIPGGGGSGVTLPGAYDEAYVRSFARAWLEEAYTNNAYNFVSRSVDRLRWIAPPLQIQAKEQFRSVAKIHNLFERTWTMRDLNLRITRNGNAWMVEFAVAYDQNISAMAATRWQQTGVMTIATRRPQPGDPYAVCIIGYRETPAVQVTTESSTKQANVASPQGVLTSIAKATL